MLTTGTLSWLFNDQQILSMLAQNWLHGVFIVAIIVFVETGLVIMPFLPGDSLLFSTGAFLGASRIAPAGALAMIVLAAVLGDGANFMIGQSALGQRLIRRGWVKPRHLAQTRAYFDRFGAMTITIGRFVPIVRTIAPFLAGLSGMAWRRFVIFNVLGAALWCCGILLAGYWLGSFAWVRTHLRWLSLAIVIISLLPVLMQWRRAARTIGK